MSALIGLGSVALAGVLAYLVRMARNISKEAHRTLFLEKTIVIVGASAGIGRSLALKYGKQRIGYNLILVARRTELLEEIKSEILKYRHNRKVECNPGTVECVVADICTSDGIATIKNAVSKVDKLDYLLLNAGVISCLSVEELNDREDKDSVIRTVFDTNTFAPINLSLALLDTIKKSGTSLIIVSSLAAIVGAPRRSVYCASKHALNGYFDSFRCEMEKYGVSVTIVNPGAVLTDIRKVAPEAAAEIEKDAVSDANFSKSGALTSEECAHEIFNAGESGVRELFVPRKYRLVYFISLFFPYLVDRMARKKYNWN